MRSRRWGRPGAAARYPCFSLEPNSGEAQETEGFGLDLPYARLVSKHLGTPLHVAKMEAARLDDLDELVWCLDEPTPDPAAFAAQAICAVARQQGVKVLLSGAGGDDLFPAIADIRPWRRSAIGAGSRALGGRPSPT